MKTDCHLHSCFSGDSDASLESMVEKAVEKHFTSICFTDHQDFDFPSTKIDFTLSTDTYIAAVKEKKVLYKDQIEILTGVELGLQPHLNTKHENYINQYPFDFVIGSSHLLCGIDPSETGAWQQPSDADTCLQKDEASSYREFFQYTLENIRSTSCFDVYGHLDYIVRYGPNQNRYYSYEKYKDLIDEILKLLIEKGKGLELNTSGLRYGLNQAHPHIDILKRYRELGGEILTLGSDGHTPESLGYAFDQADKILAECGFRYYTIFRERKPEFIPIL